MNQVVTDLVKYVEDLEAQVKADGDLIVTLNSRIGSLTEQVGSLTGQVGTLQAYIKELELKLRPVWEIKVDEVLDTARFLLQRHLDSGQTLFPYKYGGNPILNDAGEVVGGTFDCSAYTKYCYGVHGVTLPRTSANQSQVGSFIPRQEVRKGDELFFDTDGDGTVNHCGIALDNGTMIHSNPSGKGINIVALDGYWNSKFVVARRHFS
jgi:peptidoglycan endopeptidase LytE